MQNSWSARVGVHLRVALIAAGFGMVAYGIVRLLIVGARALGFTAL